MIINIQLGAQRKLKCLEEPQKSGFTENKVNVASDPKVQNCSSILESLQKLEFEVNNDINVKASLCQGEITKLNIDVIVNSVNKTLTVVGGIDGAIHKCQTLVRFKSFSN